jgi:hypothetical protein
MYKTIIMTTAYVKFQLRRDTYANWSNSDPVLFTGEPAIETDTHKMKIGDGATHYLLLPYVSGGNDRDSGTAPAPSYTFSSDLSSGMFMPSVSNLAFSTRGVERMRIDNSGSIGIGTTTPQYTFDISGTLSYRQPYTVLGTYSTDQAIAASNLNKLLFITCSGGTEIMTLPASQSDGTWVSVKAGGTANCIISGSSTSYLITNGYTSTFTYSANAWGLTGGLKAIIPNACPTCSIAKPGLLAVATGSVATNATQYIYRLYSVGSAVTTGGVLLETSISENTTYTFTTTLVATYYYCSVTACNEFGSASTTTSTGTIQVTYIYPTSTTFQIDASIIAGSAGSSITSLSNITGANQSAIRVDGITIGSSRNGLNTLRGVNGCVVFPNSAIVPIISKPSTGNTIIMCVVYSHVSGMGEVFTNRAGADSGSNPNGTFAMALDATPGVAPQPGVANTWTSVSLDSTTNWQNFGSTLTNWVLRTIEFTAPSSLRFTASGLTDATFSMTWGNAIATNYTPTPIELFGHGWFTNQTTFNRDANGESIIGEVVVSTNCSSSEVTALKSYLRTKWNVT